MKAEEKRQRFHESLLRMLYPSPPPKEDNQESVDALTEGFNLDQFPDELKGGRGSSSSSSADEGEGEGECDGPKKLTTRAQRKRLRKKKLKEAASRSGKIIGPTLPGWKDDCVGEANGDVAEEGPRGVRQNASDVPDTGPNKPESEEAPSCSKRNKNKHRRIAKKLAIERLKSSSTENQGCALSKKGECSTISSDFRAAELDT